MKIDLINRLDLIECQAAGCYKNILIHIVHTSTCPRLIIVVPNIRSCSLFLIDTHDISFNFFYDNTNETYVYYICTFLYNTILPINSVRCTDFNEIMHLDMIKFLRKDIVYFLICNQSTNLLRSSAVNCDNRTVQTQFLASIPCRQLFSD